LENFTRSKWRISFFAQAIFLSSEEFSSTFVALFVKKISISFLALSPFAVALSLQMSEQKKDFAPGFVPLSLIVRSNETILPSQTKLRLLQHIGGRILRASLRAWQRRRRLLRKANLLSSDLLPRRFARITDRCCYARRV
jgi:hypothetical protein